MKPRSSHPSSNVDSYDEKLYVSRESNSYMTLNNEGTKINEHLNKVRKARGCARGVMVKALYCGIVVSEFEPQFRY